MADDKSDVVASNGVAEPVSPQSVSEVANTVQRPVATTSIEPSVEQSKPAIVTADGVVPVAAVELPGEPVVAPELPPTEAETKQPEPVAPEPETAEEPAPAAAPKPTTQPNEPKAEVTQPVDETPKAAEPLKAPAEEPAPPVQQPSNDHSLPAAVAVLTDAELKIAAAYYLKKHQKEIALKGVAARQAQMEQNLSKMLAYIKQNGQAPLPRIAKTMNLPPGTTSKYLRDLVARGQITASGWGGTRRYTAI
ncbi:MAG: winged helix-turn-helix transcriptional regulator [Candidatus Saccharibacteria bacterium]|nr:winged helix-turn-helix transcriptional regulator [Candidatus Saccharibacteria bacterium]